MSLEGVGKLNKTILYKLIINKFPEIEIDKKKTEFKKYLKSGSKTYWLYFKTRDGRDGKATLDMFRGEVSLWMLVDKKIDKVIRIDEKELASLKKKQKGERK